MNLPRTITLTSDFGLKDGYVGIMKGVILGIAPRSVLVDITHEIGPQDVVAAAYLLASAQPYFGEDTIHLAVVDPGVGTDRRPVAIRVGNTTFVGPDNGLLMPSLIGLRAVEPESGALAGTTTAVELREEAYRLTPVSDTFHGRDIFAPAAGHIAAGLGLEELGPRLETLQSLAVPEPSVLGRTVTGTIVTIDRFGNAISNVRAHDVPAEPVISVGPATIHGLAHSYQEAETVALVGSAGFLEIGVRNGNAAATLGIKQGDRIVLRGGR